MFISIYFIGLLPSKSCELLWFWRFEFGKEELDFALIFIFIYWGIYIKNQQEQSVISFTIRTPEKSRIAGYRGIIAGYKRGSGTAEGLLTFVVAWLCYFPLCFTIKWTGLDQISPNLPESLQHWPEKNGGLCCPICCPNLPSHHFHIITSLPDKTFACSAGWGSGSSIQPQTHCTDRTGSSTMGLYAENCLSHKSTAFCRISQVP